MIEYRVKKRKEGKLLFSRRGNQIDVNWCLYSECLSVPSI